MRADKNAEAGVHSAWSIGSIGSVGVAWIKRTGKNFVWLVAPLLTGVGLYLCGSPAIAAKTAVKIPPPSVSMADAATAVAGNRRKVVFAGGCFWGVQLVFQHTRGVTQALSGYAGGTKETANYEDSSLGTTGHAQVVEVSFDPALVTYGQLLHIFFSVAHDPTQLNRQGHDVGTQYRSALFFADAGLKGFAEQYIAQLDAAKVYPDRIVTQLTQLDTFYPAEAYHQDYATLHPDSDYVVAVDLPMLANLKSLFPEYYRAEPKLVNATEHATRK